ncbi:elastin-binding protein, partial [Pseudomonas aeruginosa]|nr:elastin-binding protein [Pseudomonas aeruginosa]
MSNNNFKDDFEKNRQAIDPEDHNEQTSSHEEQEDNAVDRTEDKANQQFPPRNAQRRKRRRDIATNNNRQADSRTKDSQDGSLDDRHDDTSLNNGD